MFSPCKQYSSRPQYDETNNNSNPLSSPLKKSKLHAEDKSVARVPKQNANHISFSMLCIKLAKDANSPVPPEKRSSRLANHPANSNDCQRSFGFGNPARNMKIAQCPQKILQRQSDNFSRSNTTRGHSRNVTQSAKAHIPYRNK